MRPLQRTRAALSRLLAVQPVKPPRLPRDHGGECPHALVEYDDGGRMSTVACTRKTTRHRDVDGVLPHVTADGREWI